MDNTKESRKVSAPEATVSTKLRAQDEFEIKFERMSKYLKVIFRVFASLDRLFKCCVI